MSTTVLLACPPDWVGPFKERVSEDARVEAVRLVEGPDAALAASAECAHYCAVIDASTQSGKAVLERLIDRDADAMTVVSVRRGSVAEGLAAIRAGAQDFVEALPDGQPDIDGLLAALDRAIERSSRTIRRLREHRRMTKVLEHAGEGFLILDPGGAVLVASPSLERIWPDGFGHLDTIFDTLHPEDRAKAQQLGIAAQAEPGTPAIGELRAIDSRGTEHWFEIRINDQSVDPAIGGLITNVRDITDRVRSEQERYRAESWFWLGFENSPAGLAMATPDGVLTLANQALGEMLGGAPTNWSAATSMRSSLPGRTRSPRWSSG